MKRGYIAVLFVLLVGVVVSYGQAEPRPFLRAKIPFDFYVENVPLQAGTYSVSLVGPYNDVVEVRNMSTLKFVVVRAFPTDHAMRAGQAKLTFLNIEGEQVLTQIWEAGEGSHREIRIDKKATELARRNAFATTTILARSAKP